jgi:hypothetical protein
LSSLDPVNVTFNPRYWQRLGAIDQRWRATKMIILAENTYLVGLLVNFGVNRIVFSVRHPLWWNASFIMPTK